MSGRQPADLAAKRRGIRAITTAMALGVVLYMGVQRWLLGVAAQEPADASRTLVLVLRWATFVLAALVGGYGAYVWRLGSQVVWTRRFPPPGSATLTDVPVLEGEAARRRGRLVQGVAVVLAALALVLLAIGYRVSALVR